MSVERNFQVSMERNQGWMVGRECNSNIYKLFFKQKKKKKNISDKKKKNSLPFCDCVWAFVLALPRGMADQACISQFSSLISPPLLLRNPTTRSGFQCLEPSMLSLTSYFQHKLLSGRTVLLCHGSTCQHTRGHTHTHTPEADSSVSSSSALRLDAPSSDSLL